MATNDQISNFMRGQGDVKPVMTMSLGLELKLALPQESIACEVELVPIRKNKIQGQIEILKMTPKKLKVYTSNDTYVSSQNKYFSYSTAGSLKQGMYNDQEFKAFVSFEKLLDINKRIARNILQSSLKLRTIDRYYGKLRIYELNKPFKENNVTWMSHPEKGKLLGEVTCKGEEIITIDLGKYAKGIALREGVHNGFYIESDSYINVYSSNSSAASFTPYIEVLYYDPDLSASSHPISSEVKLKPVSVLPAEVNLKLPFPILDGEILLSRDSILGEVRFKQQSQLDCEVMYKINDQENMDTEVLFTKDSIEGQIKLGTLLPLNSEFILKTKTQLELPSEVKLKPVKHILGMVKLGYKTELPCEVNIKKVDRETLPCEVILTKPYLNSEVKIIPKGKTELDSEVILKISNNKTQLPCEVLISRDSLLSSVKLKLAKYLPCEVIVVKPGDSYLPAEVLFKSTNNKSSLTCEMELSTGLILDSEMYLSLPEILPCEMILVNNGESNVTCEMILTKVSTTALASEVNIKFANELDCEVMLKVFDEMTLPAEVLFSREDKTELACEVKYQPELRLPCEVKLRFDKSMILPCEVILQNNGESNLPCEVNLKFNGDVRLDSEVMLIFKSKTSIESEVLLEIEGQLALSCEVQLEKSLMAVHFYVIKG